MLETAEAFIHDASDWFEAIGFFLTMVTILKVCLIKKEVENIEKEYLFNFRICGYIKDLKGSSKKISTLICNIPENLLQIKLEASICIEHCRSIEKKVSRKRIENLEQTIKIMKKIKYGKIESNSRVKTRSIFLKQKNISESFITDAYVQLDALITEIEHLSKDKKMKNR